MKRRSSYAWVVLVLILGFVPAVFAQAEEADEERGIPERTSQRRISTRDLIKVLDGFYADLVKALELDEEFADELAFVFDEHTDAMRAQEASAEEARRDNAMAMRDLVKEMREAHNQGDRERVAELRQEIMELRRKGNAPDDAYLKLFEDIRQMLDEEQLPIFEKLAAEFTARLGQDGRSDVRLMQRAVSMIELSEEQKERVREIFMQARRDAREAGDSPEDREKLTASIKRMIIEELDEEQIAEFNQKLEELRAAEATPGRDGARERIRQAPPQNADEPATTPTDPDLDEQGHEDDPASAEPMGDPDEDDEPIEL
jgi:hypothetical protein